MAHSRQESISLTCPVCAASFDALVWIIIDAAERPDLKAMLLADTLHTAACQHCGAAGAITAPLLYHDPALEQVLLAVPLSVATPEEAQELAAQLHGMLLESYSQQPAPAYLGQIDLVPEIGGLQHALARASTGPDPLIEQLHTSLEALIAAPDGVAFQQVLVEQRPLLMLPEADEVLEAIIADSRATDQRERTRKAVEQRALLSRFRTTLLSRRAAMADLLDQLVPLVEDELAVLPALRTMLDAVDPQEVYAALLTVTVEQQHILDQLLERLIGLARSQEREDLSDFLIQLRSLREK